MVYISGRDTLLTILEAGTAAARLPCHPPSRTTRTNPCLPRLPARNEVRSPPDEGRSSNWVKAGLITFLGGPAVVDQRGSGPIRIGLGPSRPGRAMERRVRFRSGKWSLALGRAAGERFSCEVAPSAAAGSMQECKGV